MAIDLRLLHGLPLVCIDVVFSGRRLYLENVLLDRIGKLMNTVQQMSEIYCWG